MSSFTVAGHKAPAAPSRAQARSAENRFYTAYLIALVLLIFAGFAPSFYLRGAVPAPAPLGPLQPLVIAHGVIATLFMLAFPVQGILAAKGKLRQHMALGKMALLLAATMIPLAYVMGAGAYHGHREMGDAMVTAFVALPLFGVVTLVLALPIAWATRFDGQTHKRFIVCLACMMADPAIFRLPVLGVQDAGIIGAQTVMILTLVPLWIRDLAVDGKAHKGTLIGSGLFVGIIVTRTLLMPTQAWADLIHALPLFGLR